MRVVFSPLMSVPPDSRDHFWLQWLLLDLTYRHGLNCRVRGYPEHYLPEGNGLYHHWVIWCFFFTVAGIPSCGTLSPCMFSPMPSWVRTHDGDCYKPSVAFATKSFAVLETMAFSNTQPPAAVGTAAFSHGALVTMVTAHDLSPASFSASCRAPSTTFTTVS